MKDSIAYGASEAIDFTFFDGESFDFGMGFEEGEFEVVDVGVCSIKQRIK
jgi:hypothetical protein